MDEKKIVLVTNRSGGSVGYSVPEMMARRQFSPNETKKIPYEELVQLSYQPGGRALIYHYLLVQDEPTLREVINGTEEPEYWLTNDKIPGWINTCSLDQFVDALNFAPEGVKELIKSYAVSLPLNDVNKRENIREILDFDVDAAVKAKEAEKQTDVAGNGRIVAPTPGTTQRKTQPTYKVTRTETK